MASSLVPGIQVESPSGALLFALVLGLLNAFLRPVLFLLTLPLTLLTLGLFTFVLNALVFWLATFAPVGVRVESFFWDAFFGSVLVSLVSFVASRALR